MEINLTKEPVASLFEVLNTVSEQPVDIDFTLPDYCPDIEKILRCRITPKIYNRNISGGQLQIEGNSIISILYVDSEKGAVRACEQSIPFSASFRLKDTPEDCVVETNVKCEYVNCRALSRRKLTVHGAFSLYVKVLSKGSIELFTPENTENIEFKKADVEISVLTALSGEQFAVSDEIQINGKPPVSAIIDSDVKPNIIDYKVIPDKLMLNGELNVKMLYISDAETGKPERIDYIIPFSQVIDCAGLNEDSTVCVKLTVLSYDLVLKNDILSDSPIINLDSRIGATVIGYSSTGKTVATDAYSTEYYAVPDLTRVVIPLSTKRISDTIMHKDALEFDNYKISEILYFNVFECPLTTGLSDNTLVINSKLNFNILALDSENEPIYLEQTLDVCKEIELPEDYNNVLCSDFSIESVSYRLGDEYKIEIRCELKYSMVLQYNKCINIVSAVNTDEDKPVSKNKPALTLYYADEGESIWEIAKTYNTKQSLIISENAQVQEILDEPAMLLIPTV